MEMLPDARLYIDGEMRDASGGKTFDNINPWTGEVVGKAADASAADVDAAIAAARRAFDETDWSLKHDYRFELMKKFRDLLYANRDKLVKISMLECGAAPGAAFRAQIDGALSGADGLLECFPHVKWDEDRGIRNEYGFDTKRIVAHEAMGVVGAITPWNYPVMSAVWKIAPALLAGNSVVLKPSPYTPLSSIFMAELLEEVLPAGVLHVVAGGDALGAALAHHPRVRKVSFTGSTAAGKKVYAAGADDMRRLTLELGGNDAAIVLDDVDPDAIVEKLFRGAFENSGQVCVAIKRLYVHERVADKLTRALAERIAAAKVGAAMEEGVELGPINNAKQFERVTELVEDARARGGKIETGGARIGEQGYFFAPTLVSGLADDARLVREEQFGPALPILTFSDEADAFARANATDFGLAGSIWSGDPARAADLAGALECGTVWINQHLTIMPIAPICGWKNSGLGVENGELGLLSFTQLQTVEVALG